MKIHTQISRMTLALLLAPTLLFGQAVTRQALASKPMAQPAAVVATNVYLRTPAGWRLLAHHASPAPQRARDPSQPAARETPKILH